MKRYVLISAVASIILVSCNRNEDLGAAQDASKAEFLFNDVVNVSDEACNTGDLATLRDLDGITSGCFTITLDTVSMPHTATIDFGSANCLCNDGKYRRGIILVSFTGRYRDAGTIITITTDDYFVNDHQIIGTHTVINQGLNSSGHIYYSVSVSGQIILSGGGGTISWTSERTREWIQGSDTPEFNDDIYSITGSGSGTSAQGTDITIQITEPLIRKLEPGCRSHFVSGTVEIQPEDKPLRVLDFGNGECDNIATVTINGNTYTITLW